MSITGIPTDNGDNTVTVTGTGTYSVDGQGGTDTLVVNYSSSTNDIDYQSAGGGWYQFTDHFNSTISFYNFEKFNITSGSGDDRLQGGSLDDKLSSGAGDDILNSVAGADVIDGGSGNDRWIADYSAANIDINATLLASGFAAITGTGATVKNIENVTLNTGSGADIIDTSAVTGNDTINSGSGDDVFKTAGGLDRYDGGAGNDTLVVDYSDATTAVSTWYSGGGWWTVGDKAGTQSVTYYGVENFDITGGSAADKLSGGGGDDRLIGNGGNDVLNGGGGVDTVNGGAGTDTWVVDYSGITGAVVNLVNQTTDSGASLSGIEAINFTGSAGNDIVTANAGAYNDVFVGNGGDDTFKSGRGVDSVNGGDGVDKLVMDWSGISDATQGISNSYINGGWYQFASASGDQLSYIGIDTFDLTGGAGDDYLVGGSNKDWLRGNGGNDTLNSVTGDAVIDGGAGNDRWVADLSGENAKVLFDAVLSQTTAQVTAAGSSVRGIEALTINTGVGNDLLSTDGYALNDVIYTGGGNDTINAGLGFDSVNGGGQTTTGSDVLVVNYASLTSDVSQIYAGGGWYGYADANGTAQVVYYDIERFNVTGGSGNDLLVGANLADTLTGGAGNDTLNGGVGSGSGGAGKDIISGGDGNDTWIGDYGGATSSLAITVSAAGSGTLLGTGVNTKVTSIENFNITTGAGNDKISIASSTGNDVISTNGGNDTIDIGRGHLESVNGGDGTDTLVANGSYATSGIVIEYNSGGWYHAISNTGDYELDFYSIEHLNFTGSARNDVLVGFGDTDTLSGGAGVDVLQGAGGNDLLTGGTGKDQFFFEDAWHDGVDTITDAAAGDMLRLAGVTLNGGMSIGDGSTLVAGQVQIETVGGNTILHVGLDGTAGADFNVNLTGLFSLANFQLSGSDILIV